MGIMKKLKSIQETYDKYIMASMYGEAGASDLAQELMKERKSKRAVIRKRPRLRMHV